MEFEVVGEIRAIETIATGRGLPDGTITQAEIHWFEADGIGKRRMKIKRLVK